MAEIFASEGESIFTSGVYERVFKNAKGQAFHHVINPKTGYPGDYFVSVTVIHVDPLLADAAATALLVSDANTWQSIADSMGVKEVLLVDKHGKVLMSQDMDARINLLGAS
jgi:thiamine biosynthesis lipoprotein